MRKLDFRVHLNDDPIGVTKTAENALAFVGR